MEWIRTLKYGIKWGLWLGFITLIAGTVSSSAVELTTRQTDGYLQWQHSLEQTVKARLALGTEEGNLLFPFDLPGWEKAEVRPYRHLAISKALLELEAQWLLRGEKKEESALVALAHARNYTNLSEYDSAMVWFQAAARLDTLGLFRREINQERLAATLAANDSLALAQLITNTLGSSDLEGREEEIILAYRYLLTGRDSETLNLLLEKVEAQPELMNEQIRFWHSYSQAWLEKRGSALTNLLQLVEGGGLSNNLNEGQRTWVLLAIPDLLFLLGDNEQARSLYEALDDSSLESLRLWSVYQIANLDFLDAAFQKATNGYDQVCEAKRLGTWQDQACTMATMAREIARIQSEGEPYGTAQFYNP